MLDINSRHYYNPNCKGVLVRGLRGGCIPSTSPDLGHANVGMRVDVLLAPSKGAVGRGEDRVSAGHLLGDAPLFSFRRLPMPLSAGKGKSALRMQVLPLRSCLRWRIMKRPSGKGRKSKYKEG